MAVGPEAVVVSAPARRVPATFGARVGAHLLDVIIAFVLFSVFYGLSEIPGLPGWAEQLLASCALLSLVAYQAVVTGITGGRTVGKRVARIRVVLEDGRRIGFGRALLRDLVVKNLMQVVWPAWVISVLWVLRAPEHRALHDRIVDTRVISEPREFVPPTDGEADPNSEWLGVEDPAELDPITQRALRKQGRLR